MAHVLDFWEEMRSGRSTGEPVGPAGEGGWSEEGDVAGSDSLEAVLAPACADRGVRLYDVELLPGTLRVTVERAGGLDLDALAEVSRAIGEALEAARDAGDAAAAWSLDVELEVTSPGLERRLRRPEHFSSAIGELVALRTRPGTPGERRLEGRLDSADASGVVVTAAGVPRRLSYEEIERAHLVFDWRAALAGRRRGEEGAEGDGSARARRAGTKGPGAGAGEPGARPARAGGGGAAPGSPTTGETGTATTRERAKRS